MSCKHFLFRVRTQRDEIEKAIALGYVSVLLTTKISIRSD